MDRILLINPFGIGDVLFTTPVIKALRMTYPDSYIGYICNQRAKEILESNPYLDRVLVFEKDDYRRKWKKSRLSAIRDFNSFFQEIKKQRFGVAIDFSLGHQYSLCLMLAGVKKRIGFDYRQRGRFLTDRIKINGYSGKHVVEYYIDLLKHLNLKMDDDTKLEFHVGDKDKLWADKFLETHQLNKGKILIGVIPGGGTSWGSKYSYRHWSKENFAELVKKFSAQGNAQVILFGGKSDSRICDYMISNVPKEVLSVCGRTTLRQFAALVSKMDLVICNDGGPLHVAVACGIKTVSIFGPVDDKVYGPYPPGAKHVVIKRKLACRPCYQNFRLAECNKDRVCLRDITVAEVYNVATRLI